MTLVLLAVPGLMTMLDKPIMKERELRNTVKGKLEEKKRRKKEERQEDEGRNARRQEKRAKEDSLIVKRLEKIEYRILLKNLREQKKKEKLAGLQEAKIRRDEELRHTGETEEEKRQARKAGKRQGEKKEAAYMAGSKQEEDGHEEK